MFGVLESILAQAALFRGRLNLRSVPSKPAMASEELNQLSQGGTTQRRYSLSVVDRWEPELCLCGVGQDFTRGGKVLGTVGPLVLPDGVSD